MNIFFVNFLFTLLWGLIFIYSSRGDNSESAQKNRKKIFIIIVCIQWILISGLRADSVGSDTLNYMNLFDRHASLSWEEVFRGIRDNFLTSVAGNADEYEPGYIFLEKLISVFTANHIVYKFIIAIIFMSFLGYYIYDNSEDPCLSFIIYEGLFYNMFSLTGYRQTVSAAIGVLFAFKFIKQRRLVAYIVTVIIAALFHRSTLIMLPFCFFAYKKMTREYVLFSIALVGVLTLFRNQLFAFVRILTGYEQYSGNYGFAQGTFVLLLFILTVAVFYKKDAVLINNDTALSYYNGLILAWLMVPFAMVSPTSMRLVYDFAFVLLLLVPKFMSSLYLHSNRLIIYGTIMLIFGCSILTKTPEYFFYWQ